MYKLFIFHFILLFILLGSPHLVLGQQKNSLVFKCEACNTQQTTEFIEMIDQNNQSNAFYYYTNNAPKKIQLKVVSIEKNTEQAKGDTYKVQFPEKREIYSITIIKGGLTYQTPQGLIQSFCLVGVSCQ